MNKLYFGDNLDVLREKIPSESIDLIYLDPPFNSKLEYNVLYGTKRSGPSVSQSHTFGDTWKWGREAQRALDEAADRHLPAGALLDSFQRVFPKSDMMAYLAMMALRLIELRRVLKPTGSVYLHCDPTASHYLKILLDAIFDARNFQNEIIWRRTRAHNDVKLARFGAIHDVIFYYSRTEQRFFNRILTERNQTSPKTHDLYRHTDGKLYRKGDCRAPGDRGPRYEWNGHSKHWRFTEAEARRLEAEGKIVFSRTGMPRILRPADLTKGSPLQDIWTDIDLQNSGSSETLRYRTKKPLALLKRIIEASWNKGDVVLDPFCGCGTAIEAAEQLERKWIGIDITYLAIHVIESRLSKVFGAEIKNKYQLLGRPEDEEDARALAARNWLEFQKWAVLALGGLPMDRPGPDRGIDGIIRYHRVGIEQPNRAVVSVKGGLHVGVDAIHKLKSVVERERAEIGVLVCLDRPTAAMISEATSARDIGPQSRRVPKLQIITVDKLFEPDAVKLPGMIDPPEAVASAMTQLKPKRARRQIAGQEEMLFPISSDGSSTPEPKRRPSRQIRPVDIEVMRPVRATKRKRSKQSAPDKLHREPPLPPMALPGGKTAKGAQKDLSLPEPLLVQEPVSKRKRRR